MALINDRIRQRRIEMGLTLKQVAEELGVQEATVQRYESGAIKSIGHETIIELSDILHTNPSYLMGWNNSLINMDNGKRLARMSAIDPTMLDYFEKIKALPQYQKELIYSMIDNMKSENSNLTKAANSIDNATPEQNKHDDDIMDNDDEWEQR